VPFARASNEALDECERPFCHLAPTAVDGERVTAVGDLVDLGDRGVLSLALERCVCDRPRHRVVLLSLGEQQRPPDYAAMTKPAIGEKEFENVLLKGAAALRQEPAAAALPRCRPKRLF
jgi:hypothetical protein